MKGRIVIVTGSTQGVGLAIAHAVARAGAEGLVMTGRDATKARLQRPKSSEGGARLFVAADLEQPDAPDLIFDAALEAIQSCRRAGQFRRPNGQRIARRSGREILEPALRGQCARAILSHAKAS